MLVGWMPKRRFCSLTQTTTAGYVIHPMTICKSVAAYDSAPQANILQKRKRGGRIAAALQWLADARLHG